MDIQSLGNLAQRYANRLITLGIFLISFVERLQVSLLTFQRVPDEDPH